MLSGYEVDPMLIEFTKENPLPPPNVRYPVRLYQPSVDLGACASGRASGCVVVVVSRRGGSAGVLVCSPGGTVVVEVSVTVAVPDELGARPPLGALAALSSPEPNRRSKKLKVPSMLARKASVATRTAARATYHFLRPVLAESVMTSVSINRSWTLRSLP